MVPRMREIFSLQDVVAEGRKGYNVMYPGLASPNIGEGKCGWRSVVGFMLPEHFKSSTGTKQW
jgi:hypothetical protein